MERDFKKELALWSIGSITAIVAFFESHTFSVTLQTYVVGGVLFAATAFLFWLRFRSHTKRRQWFVIVSTVILFTVVLADLVYLLGVAAYYE